MFKTPLLKYLKICMDLSVASSLHGMKITAEEGLKSALTRSLVCMLVLVTTLITKIHGKHLCKEDRVDVYMCVELCHVFFTEVLTRAFCDQCGD